MPDKEVQQIPTNEDVTPVTPEVKTPIENQTEGTNSEAIELINQYAPGADTSTPDAIISGLCAALKKLAPFQDKIRDVVNEDTEAAAFVYDMLETGDVLKSLARNYSAEELQAVIDGMEEDDFEGDRKVYAGKISATKEKKAQHEKNVNQSQLDCQAFLDKNNISDEELPEFEKFYAELMDDARDDKMSVKHWDSIWQAYKYKDDVANAESNGQVMGRNEKIMTKKASKEDLASLLPGEGGGNISQKPVAKQQSYLSNSKSPLKKLNI